LPATACLAIPIIGIAKIAVGAVLVSHGKIGSNPRLLGGAQRGAPVRRRRLLEFSMIASAGHHFCRRRLVFDETYIHRAENLIDQAYICDALTHVAETAAEAT
jgi:hypothetical protein